MTDGTFDCQQFSPPKKAVFSKKVSHAYFKKSIDLLKEKIEGLTSSTQIYLHAETHFGVPQLSLSWIFRAASVGSEGMFLLKLFINMP